MSFIPHMPCERCATLEQQLRELRAEHEKLKRIHEAAEQHVVILRNQLNETGAKLHALLGD